MSMIGFNLANYGTLKVDFERKRYRNRILNITSAYLSPEEEGGLVGPSKVVQMFALIGLSERRRLYTTKSTQVTCPNSSLLAL